jgi:hypothetical protein
MRQCSKYFDKPEMVPITEAAAMRKHHDSESNMDYVEPVAGPMTEFSVQGCSCMVGSRQCLNAATTNVTGADGKTHPVCTTHAEQCLAYGEPESRKVWRSAGWRHAESPDGKVYAVGPTKAELARRKAETARLQAMDMASLVALKKEHEAKKRASRMRRFAAPSVSFEQLRGPASLGGRSRIEHW